MLIAAFGWRAMFVILGLGCMLWLVPWMLLVRDDDRQIEAAQQKASGASPVPFGRVMDSPVIWGTVLGTFAYQYFLYFTMTWMPTYFVERRNLSLRGHVAVHLRAVHRHGGGGDPRRLGGRSNDRRRAAIR